MSTELQRLTTTSVTLTGANTEYELSIPGEARNVRLSLADASKAWRYSSASGVVAGGGGAAVAAGGTVLLDGPFRAQTLYVASADASQTLTVSYTRPARIT